jgi:inosine-uridine nucleoside N-ribohydrolase
LLDTDIGNDIDDAVCLAYLLSQPQCDLLGVTTVSGGTVERAMLASVLCKAAGKGNVPIYPGVESPLLTPQKQGDVKQAGSLARWAHDTEFPRGEAIEFMRRTIRQNPKEVTLLAIGPMTNVALLFSVDPEIPSLLKELVLMCGIFDYKTDHYTCLAEWNALCDPFATAIVYNAPCEIKSIGLDVTTKVTMQRDGVLKNFTAPILQPVLDMAGAWFKETMTITFHDPLAAVTVFEDDVCTYKTGNVDVETAGRHTKGLTHFTADANGRNKVAFGVDSERFFKHYFDVVR